MRKFPSLIKEILDNSKKDPWYVKLKRKIRHKFFIFICTTRFLWDRQYKHYIFKKKLCKEF